MPVYISCITMKLQPFIIALAAVTVFFAPVVHVGHRWYGVERHQDVELEVDCYVMRAMSNGHGSYWGPTACMELLSAINKDNSALYLVIPENAAAETDWVEILMVVVASCTVIGNALTLLTAAQSVIGATLSYTLHRLGVQLNILAVVVGIFALNACIRLVREVSTDADVNGRTEGSVVYGAYVLLALPLLALADAVRVKKKWQQG